MKYRSLTHICSMKSIFVSHWSIILKVLYSNIKRAPSSEFVSLSIPSWQIVTAHAQLFRGARDLAFYLRVPLDSLLVWASSGGFGETARMRSPEPSLLAQAISNKFAWRGPNSLQDIKQNHWIVKYRSLAFIYFMRLIFVSHSPSITFIHQTILSIFGKITGQWNVTPTLTSSHKWGPYS